MQAIRIIGTHRWGEPQVRREGDPSTGACFFWPSMVLSPVILPTPIGIAVAIPQP